MIIDAMFLRPRMWRGGLSQPLSMGQLLGLLLVWIGKRTNSSRIELRIVLDKCGINGRPASQQKLVRTSLVPDCRPCGPQCKCSPAWSQCGFQAVRTRECLQDPGACGGADPWRCAAWKQTGKPGMPWVDDGPAELHPQRQPQCLLLNA